MPIENSESGDRPVLTEVSNMESIISKGGTPRMKEIIITICLVAKEIFHRMAQNHSNAIKKHI